MTNILWYQPAILSEQDVIICNGNKLDDVIQSTNAFSKLKEVSEKALGKKQPWHGKINGYYFVKGTLDARDERGRLLSFMFISDEEDGKQALLDTLQPLGFNMTPDTMQCVEADSRKLGRIILAALVIALLAAVAYIVITCN